MAGNLPAPPNPFHPTAPPPLPAPFPTNQTDPPPLPEGLHPQHFWVFLPTSLPGFTFRHDVTAWSVRHHATVASSEIQIRTESGIYSVVSVEQPVGSPSSSATAKEEPPIAIELPLPAPGISGCAYRMLFPSRHLALAMSLSHKLTNIDITLQADPDSNANQQHEETVSGLIVTGDFINWTIAPLFIGEDDLGSSARVQAALQTIRNRPSAPLRFPGKIRVFLFAPLHVVIEKISLPTAKAGLRSSVWQFEAAAYPYSDEEVGAVLLPHPSGTAREDLLRGTSIVIDSQASIWQCLSFGGGAEHGALVKCGVAGFQPDGRDTFGTLDGWAVVYAGDRGKLCGRNVTEKLVGQMEKEIEEWQRR